MFEIDLGEYVDVTYNVLMSYYIKKLLESIGTDSTVDQ